MPAAKNLNPVENPFGYAVRRHRTRLGLTQEQLGKRVGYSGDAIGKFEKGDVTPSMELGRTLDDVFATHGDMEQLAELVRDAEAFPRWMWEWLEFERKARTLRKWQPLVVDGLLQTEEYARKLLKMHPGMTEERVEELVSARIERQKILDRDEPLLLWVVLYEGVLHYKVGDAPVMRDQLQALVKTSERPNVTIQVVPASASVHSGMNGAFAIASFNGDPHVVYLESARAGQVTDRPDDVQPITDIWEAIRTEALPPRASLDLISKVMEQWT